MSPRAPQRVRPDTHLVCPQSRPHAQSWAQERTQSCWHSLSEAPGCRRITGCRRCPTQAERAGPGRSAGLSGRPVHLPARCSRRTVSWASLVPKKKGGYKRSDRAARKGGRRRRRGKTPDTVFNRKPVSASKSVAGEQKYSPTLSSQIFKKYRSDPSSCAKIIREKARVPQDDKCINPSWQVSSSSLGSLLLLSKSFCCQTAFAAWRHRLGRDNEARWGFDRLSASVIGCLGGEWARSFQT